MKRTVVQCENITEQVMGVVTLIQGVSQWLTSLKGVLQYTSLPAVFVVPLTAAAPVAAAQGLAFAVAAQAFAFAVGLAFAVLAFGPAAAQEVLLSSSS